MAVCSWGPDSTRARTRRVGPGPTLTRPPLAARRTWAGGALPCEEMGPTCQWEGAQCVKGRGGEGSLSLSRRAGTNTDVTFRHVSSHHPVRGATASF